MDCYDWLVIASLTCLAGLGLGRAAQLTARGVRVFAIDPERTLPQSLADLGFVLSFGLWVHDLVVTSLSASNPLLPAALQVVVLHATTARAAGVVAILGSLVIYGLALHAFGTSWRLGIDRSRPGALVTAGIFARTRNPIYVSLFLFAIGAFFVQGRAVLLLFAAVFAAYFRSVIAREERFLASRYGEEYQRYVARVGRYWTWRR